MVEKKLSSLTNDRSSGKGFELEVFRAVKQALLDRQLGFDPAAAQVYHQRPYYSRDRDKHILFDVTVELTLPGASQPSILWVWECKLPSFTTGKALRRGGI